MIQIHCPATLLKLLAGTAGTFFLKKTPPLRIGGAFSATLEMKIPITNTTLEAGSLPFSNTEFLHTNTLDFLAASELQEIPPMFLPTVKIQLPNLKSVPVNSRPRARVWFNSFST